jgi:hypothetical protein
MPDLHSIFKLAALALLLQLAGCAESDRAELRGSLYFAAGNYLAQLDLRDGSTSVVANLGDAEIRSLSPQRDDRLLLTVFGSENNKETRHLVLFDLATRQTLTLLNGRNGHYLPGTQTLVYDDGVRIFVTERVRGSWEKKLVAEHRYNEGVDIMPLSATRFVYQVGDGPFLVYDKTAHRSIELTGLQAVCRFDRAFWFAPREQMLCQVRRAESSFEYAFVGLDGTVQASLPLPAAHDLRPMAYLPDQDVLILTERWRSRLADRVRWGVWVYRFDTQEAYRLLDDQYLGDSVLYTPD